MPFSIRDELSPVVQQYAMYLRNVRGLSSKTVTEYCKDLRTFFRFVKRDRGLVPPETPFTLPFASTVATAALLLVHLTFLLEALAGDTVAVNLN